MNNIIIEGPLERVDDFGQDTVLYSVEVVDQDFNLLEEIFYSESEGAVNEVAFDWSVEYDADVQDNRKDLSCEMF